jgi:hypothetical protein
VVTGDILERPGGGMPFEKVPHLLVIDQRRS